MKIEHLKIGSEHTFLINGSVILEHRFDKVEEIKKNIYFVKKNKLWGLFDAEKNEFVTEVCYKKLEKYTYFNHINYIEVKNVKNKIGFIHLDGSVIVPCEYDYLFYDRDKKLFHAVKNKKYGLFTLDKVIVDFIYDHKTYYIDFGRNLVVVSTDGKYGQINFKGNVVTPLIYSKRIEGVTMNTFIVVDENGKYGIIDESNKVLVPFEYDFINKGSGLSQKIYYNIAKNGNYGILSENYKVLLPIGDYIVLQVIDYERIVVIDKEEKHYAFFLKQKMVIPFKRYYDYYKGWEYYNQLLFKTGHMQFDTYTLNGEFIKNCDSKYINKIKDGR